MHRFELQLEDIQYKALHELARTWDVTPGQVLRNALDETFKQVNRKKAKKPNRADERLIAPLRALLADDFAYAKSWDELQTRLKTKGYTLRESGGGLILCDWPAIRRICKGSELGYAYRLLARKFQQPFPGHAQSWR